jgi:hypothetical protein
VHHFSVLADPSFSWVQWELGMVVLDHLEWILGWNCCLGRDATLGGTTALGETVALGGCADLVLPVIPNCDSDVRY